MDMCAAVSPPPGFPYFRGPEAIASYLAGQSIRYLAFVRQERSISLYRREVWLAHQADPRSEGHPFAPLYLDIFDNFAALARTRKHLYDDGTLVLLDLAQHAAEPSMTTLRTHPSS
jgi:hypothetical protein